MKSIRKNAQHVVLLIVLFVISAACTKDDSTEDPDQQDIAQTDGISAEDIASYMGDLGLLINTRDLTKKGYQPAKVNLVTSASMGDYDQQLVIDPFTNMAQLSIGIETISEAAADELRNGVGLDIEILDSANNVLTAVSYSLISFEENGKQIDINASALPYVNQNVVFMEGARHYIQLVDFDGSVGNGVVWKPSSAQDNNVVLELRQSTFNRGTTSEQYFFYKFPNQENTFAIWSANTSRYLATDANDKTFRQSGAVSYPSGLSDNSLSTIYRFKIERDTNGLYTINDFEGNPMRSFSNNGKIGWRTNTSNSIQYFRIISLDIDWESQVLDTEHLQPIFPAVDTSFGFNSTLRNCGSGSLEQQVGIEKTVETTYTTLFSESIGLSSRVTTSVEASVSATAEASFFGNGGSVTGEVSTSLELSVEANRTTTVGTEESVAETNTFFSSRTVTVPPGSASLVYDAYQTYSNVRIPYVKRFRLNGRHSDSGAALTGQEIVTQLNAAIFTGTVTNIGSDYVEISVRGNMFLDNIVDTQTEVRDVPANCGG